MSRVLLRQALARRLSDVRTISGLVGQTPKSEVVAKLTDSALAFAAQNPDHSEAGRGLARAELARRVGEAEAQRRMDEFVNGLPTPGFLKAEDVSQNDNVFFGLGRWLRIAAGLAASAATILSIAYFVYVMTQPSLADAVERGLVPKAQYEAYLAMPVGDERTAEEKRLESLPGVAEVVAGENAAVDGAANWVLASWLAFPVWALGTASRRKPARILLLRKFNNRAIGRSIEKMSNANLRPYGHVFTLADKHFKRNWLWSFLSQFWASPLTMMVRFVTVPIGFVRRFWDRSRDGPILVWHARDFRHFARRFEDRPGLNLEMARTQRKAVMVRTSDAWWQHVVEITMHAADVIVIDLTEVSSGTVWELQKAPQEDVVERVVFVVREDRSEQARAELLTHGYAEHVPHLQIYGANGRFVDRASFRAEVRAALTRRLQRQPAEA